jgi:hypothetical protein
VSPQPQWCNGLGLPCAYAHDIILPHDQPSRWRSEGTSLAGTHPITPFQCHLDQISHTVEHAASQQIPRMETARSSSHYRRDSQERHYCAYCDRKYRRAQELRRHIKDKHQQPEKCSFCNFKWTRPEQSGHISKPTTKVVSPRKKSRNLADYEDRMTRCPFLRIIGLQGFWEITCSALRSLVHVNLSYRRQPGFISDGISRGEGIL